MNNIFLSACLLPCCFSFFISSAQPVMETGGQKMPDEWIDKTTGHKVIKLTRREGSNMSFYFHNNPFAGSKMVFYGTNPQNSYKNDSVKQEIYNVSADNKQIKHRWRKQRMEGGSTYLNQAVINFFLRSS